MKPFGWLRREARPDRAEAARVKADLRRHLSLGPEDVLTVSEIACPACGPDAVETVALVMRRGAATVALKSRHSLAALAADPTLVDSFAPGEDHGG